MYSNLYKNLSFCFFLSLALAANSQTTIYSDNFETWSSWGMFEEIVAGNTCYGDNIGSVEQETAITHTGNGALAVWSNKSLAAKSNHVLGTKFIYPAAGLPVGQYRYSLYAYLPSSPNHGQTGPEWSLQTTRNVAGTNLTFIPAIQYIRNPWVLQRWNIWHEGAWIGIPMSAFNLALEMNTWYLLELSFDLVTNRYLSFHVEGGSLDVTLDLTQSFTNAASGYKIAGEARGWTPSTFITAESENLWTACAQNVDQKALYDDVLLQEISGVLPLEILAVGLEKNMNSVDFYAKIASLSEASTAQAEWSKDGLRFEPFGAAILLKKTEEEKSISVPFLEETSGKAYFRWHFEEKNGKITFSKLTTFDFSFSENPVLVRYANGRLSFSSKTEKTERYSIEIYAEDGRLLCRKIWPTEIVEFQIDLPQKTGVFSYVVRSSVGELLDSGRFGAYE